ncbi:hypothetical protein BJV82DRAFT_573769 [Fennellomyces sp. T-0311]|nr:hypothetical protein BJV82DRAFT_573769 [Fennellomyces sp. T-0311]
MWIQEIAVAAITIIRTAFLILADEIVEFYVQRFSGDKMVGHYDVTCPGGGYIVAGGTANGTLVWLEESYGYGGEFEKQVVHRGVETGCPGGGSVILGGTAANPIVDVRWANGSNFADSIVSRPSS